MYDRFLDYLHAEKLFERTDKLLLGVSGGVDSVVLATLIKQLGNTFAIAHCNFNLRGEESDADELFVKNLAAEMGVPFFTTSFSTHAIAEEQGISIEMAARDLRYKWFEEIRSQHGFNWIVVGHHLDDVLETFLLNLSRGTGIRGLSGIKPKAGKVVRPLLFATRNEVDAFARENQLSFRYDSSNSDIVFKRNLLRHKVLPVLQELNPAFKQNFQRTIQHLENTEQVFLQKIEQERLKAVKETVDWVTISKGALMSLDPISIYLFEFLRPYQFNAEVVNEIIQAIDGTPGTQFHSISHRLVVDRHELIITPITAADTSVYYIEKDTVELFEPLHLRISVEANNGKFIIPKVPNIAVFDYHTLRFPLTIRKWKSGESFKPLGMSGFKKISDFFIDEKYSLPEKEKTWMLIANNQVAWIMGKRIDDRFKVLNKTVMILKIEILND